MANEICIRDPIHNYIDLTEVEKDLVKHKLFQRLRFISQNGTAYFTYPSNKNCRFLHSLGCMKIGGDIFLNATENLTDDTVGEFLDRCFQMLKDISNHQLNADFNNIVKLFIRRKDKTFTKFNLDLLINETDIESHINSNKMVQRKFSKAIIFQSVRLACVLHDIGHFPFSHVLEKAFGKYIASLDPESAETNEVKKNFTDKLENIAEKSQLHERIGIAILDCYIPTDNNDFHKLCRSIARMILNEKPPSQFHDLILTLHGIISSEIDADRIDYTLRDPRSSGLELGAFDLERLINNYQLIKLSDGFKFLPTVQALSSIESFYHQRFLVYKYLIYHHSKVRMDEIIQEITIILINYYLSSNTDKVTNLIKHFLNANNYNFLWKECNSDKYYYCNENWYFAIIQNLHIELCKLRDLNKSEVNELQKIKLLIETFLFRLTRVC